MESVFVTRMIRPEGIDLLKKHFNSVEVWEENAPCPREILEQKASEVSALLTQLNDKIDETILSNQNLKIVSQCAVGVDNIDLEAATRHNVVISHTPGVLTNSCADHAWALMMAAARRLPESAHYVMEGKWTGFDPNAFLGYDIYGSTLGVIGPGRIGQAVAKRASGFNMKVLYHGPHEKPEMDALGAQYASLEDLLKQADFVVLTCPLNDKTRGMIGAAQFDLMKKTATLINIARGPIIKTDDLVEALENHKINAAALDVVDPEPIPANHRLLQLPNCLMIPHIASATYKTRGRMAEICAEAIIDHAQGRRIAFCANPQVYN